jgi:hypothetical protein
MRWAFHVTRVILLTAPGAIGIAAAQGPPHNDVARMQSINRALDVECSYCHIVDQWKRDEKPPFPFALRMTQMMEGLNTGTLHDVGGVTCWSCHRGALKPKRMPREGWQDRLAHWPDALKLSPEDAREPASEVYKNIQLMTKAPAGSLPTNMSIYASALGVSCDYCHVPGDWESDEKPAKRTARRMITMFTEFPKYFEGSRQPSMQCYTCHHGSAKPERQPPG